MWAAGFKWMFLIIGATIGAGYVSGRELWQFFGHESGLAILLFSIFFTICCSVIMNISYRMESSDYLPVLKEIVGKRLTGLYDLIIFFYLFSTTVIMIAGSGSAGQVFNFPYWWGIAITVIALILLFKRDIQVLLTINQILLPFLIIGLLFVLFLFSFDQQINMFSHWHEQRNWAASFPFTALNILPLIAVLGAIGNKVKSTGEIKIASIGSGLILGGLSFIYNSSLVQIADEILVYEIPLFAILKDYPVELLTVMAILLWFAIFTTSASNLLGITARIRSYFNMPLGLLVFIILAIMVPLSSIGFSALIGYLYPIYGIVNLYVLVRLLLIPVWNRIDRRKE